VAPRLTGVLNWAVVVSFSVNPALEYEGDVLLGVLAFYLAVGFLIGPARRVGQSWLSWLFESGWPLNLLTRHPGEARHSFGANLALRLFQVHFAIIIVTTGLHKLQFGDWWAGVALWYPLVPAMETTVEQARAMAGTPETFLLCISVAAYAVLAWQLTFPVFAWRSGWRWLLVGGAVAGALGVAFLYGLPVTGPVLVVGCLAYLSPQEWRRWLGRLAWLRRAVSRPGGRLTVTEQRPRRREVVKVGVGPYG
jgi:hypothetical protein